MLDTDICIFYLKGIYDLREKVESAGMKRIYISEITLAELKFGAANSNKPLKNRKIVEAFRSRIKLIPIYNCIDYYATEKARLQKAGTTIDDFDLIIGTSAVVNGLIMVTNNTKHFKQIRKIKLTNWVAKAK